MYSRCDAQGVTAQGMAGRILWRLPMNPRKTSEKHSAKRILRRALPAALVLFAVCLVLTTPAAAAEPGGIDITGETASGLGDKATYTAGTLTLNGGTWKYINADSGLTIVLNGENTIDGGNSFTVDGGSTQYGIRVTGSLTIQDGDDDGVGSLTVSGIAVDADSGEVSAVGLAADSISIKGGTVIVSDVAATCSGEGYSLASGLWAFSEESDASITIEEGSTVIVSDVTATATSTIEYTMSLGLYADTITIKKGGTVIVSDVTATATGADAVSASGLSAETITIEEGGTVTVSGIVVDGSGDTVMASGLSATTSISISGGTVTVSDVTATGAGEIVMAACLYSEASLSITGGTVIVSGVTVTVTGEGEMVMASGLYADTITINGGSVTVSGVTSPAMASGLLSTSESNTLSITDGTVIVSGITATGEGGMALCLISMSDISIGDLGIWGATEATPDELSKTDAATVFNPENGYTYVFITTNSDSEKLSICTVTFNANGGTPTPSPQILPSGVKAAKPIDPTNGEKIFAGWYLGDTKYDFTTPVTGNIELTAKWNTKQHTITFNTDGGSAIPPIKQDSGTAVTAPADPTREGYTFAGWYLGDTKYDFTAKVTQDITLKAKWNENPKTGEGVEVKPTISVDITVDSDGKTATIPAPAVDSSTTVELSDTKDTATVTDKSTGVQMKITFSGEAAQDSTGITGSVSSVEVMYPEASAETDGEVDIKQEVNFVMGTATDKLPTIDSKKDNTVVEKVEKQNQRANVLAMITARDNLEEINKNIKEVKITFTVPASLISNQNNLQGYHVDDDSNTVTAVPTRYDSTVEGGHKYIITSELGFSSYVLVEEEPQKSSGGAVDTGSGNYQYYPRSVPADGIVDFGTSRVVTGMELPAGSDGTVTLNIKPTFTMPENGFYAFEIDAPGYNLDAKINGGLSFQIPTADLEAAGFTAEDIVLFHGTVAEDGTIVWEALPTNLVRSENGVAYYKASVSACSPFYIGFVKDGSVVNTEAVEPTVPETPETPETPVTPDEPEILPPIDPVVPETPEQPESPAPILAVLAGLGAVVVLRRK